MKFEKRDILYEDPSILVCRKRPGMAVQSAGPGRPDLESALKNYLALKNPDKGVPYLGVIQRLDQPVEGVLVFALTKGAAASLNRQAAEGRMMKNYLALVRASLTPGDSGEMADRLKKEGRCSVVLPLEGQEGKDARLAYEVLAEGDGKSLLLIRLYTGRYHQIRCQLARREMPIVGDILYGQGEARLGAIGLCACRLSFDHPDTGRRMDFAVWPEHDVFRQFFRGAEDVLEVLEKNIYNAVHMEYKQIGEDHG